MPDDIDARAGEPWREPDSAPALTVPPRLHAARPSPHDTRLEAAPAIPKPPVGAPDVGAGSIGPPSGPRGVFLPDGRRQVPDPAAQPWCRICHLEMHDAQGRRFGGTGWLAGPSTVFTAGHNLLQASRGHAAVRVLVRDNTQAGAAPLLASAFDVHPQWRNGEDAGSDVGVLWLPQPLGNRLGWFGFVPQPPQVLQNLQVRLSGYPADKPFATQWFHDGPIEQVGQTLLGYHIDTKPGQSGSPAFVADAQDKLIALAVHAYDDDTQNLGVRITPALFEVLRRWWR